MRSLYKPGNLMMSKSPTSLMNWRVVNFFLGVILVLLTITVSLPLTIRTIRHGGGPWGFEVISLHILLPLTTYLLFAWSAFIKSEKYQWWTFIGAHLTSLYFGLLGFWLFPILPSPLLFIPLFIAVISFFQRKRLHLFLALMLILGVALNVVLLKWELDFHRTLPLIQLFETNTQTEPW